jgi:hypothetical protein
VLSVVKLSSLGSSAPGDYALFFDVDALCEGVNDKGESFTETCVILFPCQVCVMVTSNMSAFDAESLIFGIARYV